MATPPILGDETQEATTTANRAQEGITSFLIARDSSRSSKEACSSAPSAGRYVPFGAVGVHSYVADFGKLAGRAGGKVEDAHIHGWDRRAGHASLPGQKRIWLDLADAGVVADDSGERRPRKLVPLSLVEESCVGVSVFVVETVTITNRFEGVSKNAGKDGANKTPRQWLLGQSPNKEVHVVQAPIRLQEADLGELVAELALDETVTLGPLLPDEIGGETMVASSLDVQGSEIQPRRVLIVCKEPVCEDGVEKLIDTPSILLKKPAKQGIGA